MIDGRDDRAGRWMPTWPTATLGACLMALMATAAAGQFLYAAWLTPAQRYYLKPYVQSTLAAHVNLAPKVYQLQPLIPTPARYAHAAVRDFLASAVYDGHSLTRVAAPALAFGLIAWGLMLCLAMPWDLKRAHERRHGRRLQGPQLVSGREFNKLVGGDGIALTQQDGSVVRLPRFAERSHGLDTGVTGTGKSVLARQRLVQIRERGERAVVYDPAMEFTPQFYRPGIDVLLNPMDARMPYWNPSAELRPGAEAYEALTLAQALIPEHGEQPFFTEGPRQIFAYLLTLGPTAHDLVNWLKDGDELDRRLAGTTLAAIVARQAPEQRSGVLANLNMVADALQLLPREADACGEWSAMRWATEGQGWIFLTSTPPTRARLVPLHSLWLDLLILRLMDGHPQRPATWLLLDEVASLHRLPQLHTALCESRKYNNPIIIGCQDKAQLEARYGRDAATMISQPATKIFLRTSEPRSAEWASKAIGDVETERLRESRQDGWARSSTTSYGLERHVEPLVMASKLQTLPNLDGYLSFGQYVTPLHLQYLTLPAREPAFIARASVEPSRPIPMPKPAPVTRTSRLAQRLE